MPNFAANLSMMFQEIPNFLDRFDAAAKAGFKGVEFLFPYDFPPEAIAERLERNHLTLALFNLPPGDWAKGEFRAANKEAGKDFLCYRFPGTDGSVLYNTDMFAMFNVPADRKAAQLALADATMSISFQSAFNVVKGSVPARMDVPDTAFDSCGKKGIADVKAANADGKFVGSMAQNYAQPPAIAGAYHDVVTKFFHGEIKSSDAAVTELDKAINAAK